MTAAMRLAEVAPRPEFGEGDEEEEEEEEEISCRVE
jgi:hypothetical protein